MGCESSSSSNIIIRDKSCLICHEDIINECSSCFRCRILYHPVCFSNYCNENYTKCALCSSIGTIITCNIEYEIQVDKGIIKFIE